MRFQIRYFFSVKKVCFALLVILFFNLNIVRNLLPNSAKYPHISNKKEVSPNKPTTTLSQDKMTNKLKCTQWIVITTISLPTDDVKYIHDSAFDWCVVVVADKKTPTNWSYKNIIFLSIQEQKQMSEKFKVAK